MKCKNTVNYGRKYALGAQVQNFVWEVRALSGFRL